MTNDIQWNVSFQNGLKLNPQETIVFGVFVDEDSPHLFQHFNDEAKHCIMHTMQNSKFAEQMGGCEVLNIPYGMRALRIILVSLGRREDLSVTNCHEIGAKLLKNIKRYPSSHIVIDASNISEAQGNGIIFGFLEASYSFGKYKTINKPQKIYDHLTIVHPQTMVLASLFERTKAILEGLFFTRELICEPSNILTPQAFAFRCKELEALGIVVNILEKKDLERLSMGALLSVAQGSDNLPYVVTLEYRGSTCSADINLALIGKGVCFDAGGISLKPQKNMHLMRYDMAGAAAVVGAMIACTRQRLPLNMIGVIGLIENMPSGCAIKPGDVVTAMSGTTIEVINTDAEGRLVLADCLYYAQQKFDPKMMVDLGTLTPETIASLGYEYAGLYTRDDNLANLLTQAGVTSGEYVWRLPMGKAFRDQLNSRIADITNLGNETEGENGAAAEFLSCFVKLATWAHLDIAGVAMKESLDSETELTLPGYGVRILEELASSVIPK